MVHHTKLSCEVQMMKELKFTSEEAFFLEKLCDDQQGAIDGRLSRIAEHWMYINALAEKDEGSKSLHKGLINTFKETARTTLLLQGLRKKFENLRKDEI